MTTTIGTETLVLAAHTKTATVALRDHLKAAWEDAVDDYDPADAQHTLWFLAEAVDTALNQLVAELHRLMTAPRPTVDW